MARRRPQGGKIRLTGPSREQFRLFCVLENAADEELLRRGLTKPAIAVITGMRKPWRTKFSEADYSRVRRLGDDHRPHSGRPYCPFRRRCCQIRFFLKASAACGAGPVGACADRPGRACTARNDYFVRGRDYLHSRRALSDTPPSFSIVPQPPPIQEPPAGARLAVAAEEQPCS